MSPVDSILVSVFATALRGERSALRSRFTPAHLQLWPTSYSSLTALDLSLEQANCDGTVNPLLTERALPSLVSLKLTGWIASFLKVGQQQPQAQPQLQELDGYFRFTRLRSLHLVDNPPHYGRWWFAPLSHLSSLQSFTCCGEGFGPDTLSAVLPAWSGLRTLVFGDVAACRNRLAYWPQGFELLQELRTLQVRWRHDARL